MTALVVAAIAAVWAGCWVAVELHLSRRQARQVAELEAARGANLAAAIERIDASLERIADQSSWWSTR